MVHTKTRKLTASRSLLLLCGVLSCLSCVVNGQVWTPAVLINAGATTNYTDTKGDVWGRDRYVTANGTGTFRNSNNNFTIKNTDDDTLYLYNRRDASQDAPNMVYRIPLANGDYKVVLHWAELQKVQAGKRVFQVRFNGVKVVADLDVFAEAGGRFLPLTKELMVNVTTGKLTIMFEPTIDLPFISAIGVYSKKVSVGLSQPTLTIVERNPVRKAQGSVSIPEGSPWCAGGPTFWWIGHDNLPETPACQNLTTGKWSYPQIAALDQQDPLNVIDGPDNIDRHDCTLIDMNQDNVMDLVCVVGANKGKGNGFNEVYITQSDGSVKKVLEGHGLQKYPTMRTRMVITLTAGDGGKLVMIANEGIPRKDGKPNEHRMFRLITPATMTNPVPFFDEVDPKGPWVQTFVIKCLVGGDLNNDGLDDFIMCDEDGPSQLFVQKNDLTWTGINLKSTGFMGMAWNNVRIADVTGDGVADLIACGPHTPWKKDRDQPFVRVYKGDPGNALLFDFANPYYEWRPQNEAFDVEVLDLNGDGILDIYVVLQDRFDLGTYCRDGTVVKGAPFPPLDLAHDYVLVGNGTGFVPFELLHEQPGCGAHVAKWGDRSVMVHEGDLGKFGFGLLLEW